MRNRISRLNQLAASDGFSIIEVLAAVTLLGIVTIGILPLFISGLRTSLSARFETQAKNLAQERFDLMRNLPFHVASFTSTAPAGCWNDPLRSSPLNGAVTECDYKDLLDTYYRSVTFAAASTSTGGYVATDAGRSADEVSEGIAAPFYRYVINPVPNFQSGLFSQVVVSQFMDASRNVITPASTYNSQDLNNDQPAAQLLGVTLITRWNVGTTAKKYVVFTQMGDAASLPTKLSLQAQATAIRLSTSSDPSAVEHIQLEAGISRSDGSISNATSASTYAQGGFVALVPGTRLDGKYATSSAPGTTTSGGSAGYVGLTTGSPLYTAASLGASDVSNATAAIVADQPSVPGTGTPGAGTNLSTGSLLRSGAANDLTLTNGPVGTLTGLPLLTGPPVSAKVSGSGSFADGLTYVKSQAGTGHYGESGAQASGTASSFDVTVSHYTPVGYTVPLHITSLVPSALPDLTTSLGLDGTLGTYIKSWSVASGATITPSASGDSVTASLNGVLHITTQNTKLGDDSSAVQMDFGVLSCTAQDDR